MKVGVNLINYGPGATPDSLARWARLTEALGYHLLLAPQAGEPELVEPLSQ